MNIYYLETTHSRQSTSDHCANPLRASGTILEELRVKNITWDLKIVPESLGLDCSSDDKPTQQTRQDVSYGPLQISSCAMVGVCCIATHF